jgi:hypothetical protein
MMLPGAPVPDPQAALTDDFPSASYPLTDMAAETADLLDVGKVR